MDPLWNKISFELVEELLNKACHTYPVTDNIHFLVNRTAVRDILFTFVEENLESYEFKKPGR